MQTAARIRPGLWARYRGSLIFIDGLVGSLALLGCCTQRTLIRLLYVFSLSFSIIQLLMQLLVWPHRQAHPHCFPTYRRKACGSVSTDMLGTTEGELDEQSWALRKLPYFILWLLGYTAFLVMVCATGQRLMIYPGTLIKVRIPDDFSTVPGMDVELVSFFTRDRMRLSALFAKPTNEAQKNFPPDMPRLTMWIFYGNTGNMVMQVDSVVPLMRAAYPNLQFFIFSYRGYANSDGRPHINGLRKDIDAAVRYLRGRADVEEGRVCGYGHSIGGALVADVVGRHPGFLKRVIISNTFKSMRSLAASWHLHPLMPFITDPWDSEQALRTAKQQGALPPMLFMSSRKDGLIPPSHMDSLSAIAFDTDTEDLQDIPSVHTRLILPEGEHNNWADMRAVHAHWHSFFHALAAVSIDKDA